MSLERLKERVERVQARIPTVMNRGEAVTKQVLVLSIIEALGYDIWNPTEVFPEYEGDFAIKKAGQKEKVDIAILLDNAPKIFVEVKPAECDLDGHQGQLARYFNAVQSVSLGVLTNGVEWRFYTDSNTPNLMDPKPFYTFNLQGIDWRLEVLTKFSKDAYNPEAVRDFAIDLFYTANIVTLLRNELDLRGRPPSEAFVRWVLGHDGIYDGRVVSSVVERFSPIISTALQSVIREIVRRSFVAIDQTVAEPPPVTVAPPAMEVGTDEHNDDDRPKIQTTSNELAFYVAIEDVLSKTNVLSELIFEPSQKKEVAIELGYKDTTGYFGVYFNKPSWWVCRLFVDTRNPWIGFPLDLKTVQALLPGLEVFEGSSSAACGVRVQSPSDIARLSAVLAASARAVIRERRS